MQTVPSGQQNSRPSAFTHARGRGQHFRGHRSCRPGSKIWPAAALSQIWCLGQHLPPIQTVCLGTAYGTRHRAGNLATAPSCSTGRGYRPCLPGSIRADCCPAWRRPDPACSTAPLMQMEFRDSRTAYHPHWYARTRPRTAPFADANGACGAADELVCGPQTRAESLSQALQTLRHAARCAGGYCWQKCSQSGPPCATAGLPIPTSARRLATNPPNNPFTMSRRLAPAAMALLISSKRSSIAMSFRTAPGAHVASAKFVMSSRAVPSSGRASMRLQGLAGL